MISIAALMLMMESGVRMDKEILLMMVMMMMTMIMDVSMVILFDDDKHKSNQYNNGTYCDSEHILLWQ